MIALARAVDAQSRRQRKRYEDEVAGVERDAYARIARAVFAVQGPAAYPDATSTLRLAYGRVRGYQENGRAVAPFTNFAGLYARAASHQSEPPGGAAYAPVTERCGPRLAAQGATRLVIVPRISAAFRHMFAIVGFVTGRRCVRVT